MATILPPPPSGHPFDRAVHTIVERLLAHRPGPGASIESRLEDVLHPTDDRREVLARLQQVVIADTLERRALRYWRITRATDVDTDLETLTIATAHFLFDYADDPTGEWWASGVLVIEDALG